MTFRPGARPTGRPLHFVFLLDGSGSMAVDGKIDALNAAVRAAVPDLREVAAQNPFAELLVRAVVFADGARWHVADPTPIAQLEWPPVQAGGFTDLGAALTTLAAALRVPPMEPRALPPVLVLVSDGQPTDDFELGLAALMAEPWGRRAIRLAIAIGGDADLDVLGRFISNPEIRPFTAAGPEQLAYLIRFVSTAASRIATEPARSAPLPSSTPAFPEPHLPEPADQQLLVW